MTFNGVSIYLEIFVAYFICSISVFPYVFKQLFLGSAQGIFLKFCIPFGHYVS